MDAWTQNREQDIQMDTSYTQERTIRTVLNCLTHRSEQGRIYNTMPFNNNNIHVVIQKPFLKTKKKLRTSTFSLLAILLVLSTAPSGCHGLTTSSSINDGSIRRNTLGIEPDVESTIIVPEENHHGPQQQKQKKKKKPRPRIPILQYHNDWVCVNKPAGMTVHKNRSTRRTATLTSTVKRQLARKVSPVHRLDHRTSGAILFAFNSETCAKIQNALSKGTKHYVALLRGEWKYDADKTVIVDRPIRIDDVEKDAVTKFSLLATCSGNQQQQQLLDDKTSNSQPERDSHDNEQEYTHDPSRCTLVLCEPLTGRTHQIRKHASSLSQPILGDTQHGDTKVNRWWRNNRGLDRLALHCLSLDLPSWQDEEEEVEDLSKPDGSTTDEESKNNERTVCVAPLPPDFASVLQHPDLVDFWNTATANEPRLMIEEYDETGGSFGRYYRKRVADNDAEN